MGDFVICYRRLGVEGAQRTGLKSTPWKGHKSSPIERSPKRGITATTLITVLNVIAVMTVLTVTTEINVINIITIVTVITVLML